MKNKTVAVVIDFNDGENIVRSLRDLLSYADIHAVVVVDNGSTDNSIARVQQLGRGHKNLYIIKSRENLGFAKAANRGIRKALKLGAEYVALLNPDMVFQRDFVTKLISNGADMVQFMLKFRRGGKLIYDYAGKINWPLGKIFHIESDSSVNPHPEIKTDYVSGGASVIGRRVFEKIGLFDERFFMYFEDADFSLRAKKAGFTIAIEPNVVIEHKLEIVKKTKNWQKIKNNMIANFHFISKDVPWYFKPTAYLYLVLVTVKIGFNLITK